MSWGTYGRWGAMGVHTAKNGSPAGVDLMNETTRRYVSTVEYSLAGKDSNAPLWLTSNP